MLVARESVVSCTGLLWSDPVVCNHLNVRCGPGRVCVRGQLYTATLLSRGSAVSESCAAVCGGEERQFAGFFFCGNGLYCYEIMVLI